MCIIPHSFRFVKSGSYSSHFGPIWVLFQHVKAFQCCFSAFFQKIGSFPYVSCPYGSPFSLFIKLFGISWKGYIGDDADSVNNSPLA